MWNSCEKDEVKMDVRIFDQEDELAEQAAIWCSGAITRAIRDKGMATIVLSSEATQLPFLEKLAIRSVDWSCVTCFQLCELRGLNREDPRSYRCAIKDKLWDRVSPPLKEYHTIDYHSLEEYSQLLGSTELDLVCVGIEDDGSVGFNPPCNDPPEESDVNDVIFREVQLTITTKRQLMDERKFESLESVPDTAFTLDLLTMLRAKAVSVTVPDIDKSHAVRAALLGKVGMSCPASLLRDHPNSVMWLDYHSAISYLAKMKAKPQYGAIKIPGLVDMQVTGYNGVGFGDIAMTEDQFRTCCRDILASGIAVFLPTLITSPMEVYERNIPIMVKVIKEDEFTLRVPGLNLDGPFISRAEGATSCHHQQNIRDPDEVLLDRLLNISEGKILVMTVAAELHGAVELANYASAQGVKISLGHQMAGSVEIRHLVRAGAKMLTHFGNGIPAMIHRQQNPLWPSLVEPNLTAAIITDGHHLSNDIIKAVLQVKGVDKTILTSDMTAVTGLQPGQYDLFGGVQVILEANGAVYLESGEWFAGSAMTLLQCTNYLIKQDLADVGSIQKMCFYNPLKLLGIDPNTILANVRPSLKITRKGAIELIEADSTY